VSATDTLGGAGTAEVEPDGVGNGRGTPPVDAHAPVSAVSTANTSVLAYSFLDTLMIPFTIGTTNARRQSR
jgi:hypothetical protein